ncbi:hypothetical protein J6590_081388 [Homalodisca vitripennis]|nr:hypothetical protein J6590_081388 [Homalodisca vitripennis]
MRAVLSFDGPRHVRSPRRRVAEPGPGHLTIQAPINGKIYFSHQQHNMALVEVVTNRVALFLSSHYNENSKPRAYREYDFEGEADRSDKKYYGQRQDLNLRYLSVDPKSDVLDRSAIDTPKSFFIKTMAQVKDDHKKNSFYLLEQGKPNDTSEDVENQPEEKGSDGHSLGVKHPTT